MEPNQSFSEEHAPRHNVRPDQLEKKLFNIKHPYGVSKSGSPAFKTDKRFAKKKVKQMHVEDDQETVYYKIQHQPNNNRFKATLINIFSRVFENLIEADGPATLDCLAFSQNIQTTIRSWIGNNKPVVCQVGQPKAADIGIYISKNPGKSFCIRIIGTAEALAAQHGVYRQAYDLAKHIKVSEPEQPQEEVHRIITPGISAEWRYIQLRTLIPQ